MLLTNSAHAGDLFSRLNRFVRRGLRPALSNQSPSVVIVGCARNTAPHLPSVLRNVERIAQIYARAAFVFVENDSNDDTAGLLREWLARRPNGHLLQYRGLAKRLPKRTERLAYTRNSYIEFIRGSKYREFDHLVILDFDEVNAAPIEIAELEAATQFLSSTANVAGVFANSLPVYYDVWALRQSEWCPEDCWVEQRAAAELEVKESINRYVHSRQVFIPSDSPPIAVTSAFGGLAIMKLADAIKGRYRGLYDDGMERCEHVTFNQDLATRGALYIFPSLHVQAPPEHLAPEWTVLGKSREIVLRDKTMECRLIGPREHPLDRFRAAHPLYDRRLPMLAALISEAEPDTAMVDVGANIGDTAALCRMAGCKLEILAVEPSAKYHAYLIANQKNLPALFENVVPIRAFIGNPGDDLALVEERGTAFVRSIDAVSELPAHEVNMPPTIALNGITTKPVSIVKTDTDGYDAAIIASNFEFIAEQQPILWAEADTSSATEEAAWPAVLERLSTTYTWVCVFDNFGFLLTHGLLSSKREIIIDLIDYCRRHKAVDQPRAGLPTIYYLDIAFFPVRFEGLYRQFLTLLPEANALYSHSGTRGASQQ